MTINLCGVPYEVRYVDETFCSDTQLGEITFLKGIIRINNDLPLALKELTLWHEAVHGILTLIGRDDLSNDETFVDCLANALNGLADIRKEIP